jgi:hypothetical protein
MERANREQIHRAARRRGFQRDWINRACATCGHARGDHFNRTGDCLECDCVAYVEGYTQALPPAPRPRVRIARPAVELAPRNGSASRCPFCHTDDFDEEPALKCPRCKAWQHAECVEEAGRCGACGEDW